MCVCVRVRIHVYDIYIYVCGITSDCGVRLSVWG